MKNAEETARLIEKVTRDAINSAEWTPRQREHVAKLLEQYATLREKETAIGFLMYHLGKSEALAQYQRDIYERKFDKYTKHKEQ